MCHLIIFLQVTLHNRARILNIQNKCCYALNCLPQSDCKVSQEVLSTELEKMYMHIIINHLKEICLSISSFHRNKTMYLWIYLFRLLLFEEALVLEFS